LPLEAILRDLLPADREILVATYFRRQTTRQAAQQLGITHEDARRRVYHATRQLTAVIGAARHNRPYELPATDPGRWRRGAVTR
jgi:DNA-directed RNA polymerase specialized sigma24 family protein